MSKDLENQSSLPVPEEIKYLDDASRLLDSQFRIPGTQIRFGIDSLIGIVPYIGDAITYFFSGLLVIAMIRNGASGMVVLKMIFNVLIDTVVGAIPFLGDIFDIQFKANRRNYKLLSEHYREGKHGGSAWPVILTAILLLIVTLVFSVYLMVIGFRQLINWVELRF